MFASNRGNNSVSVFDVSDTGMLSLRSLTLGIEWPRDIAVLGNSLLALERDGGGDKHGALSVFDIVAGAQGPALPSQSPPRELHSVASPCSTIRLPRSLSTNSDL